MSVSNQTVDWQEATIEKQPTLMKPVAAPVPATNAPVPSSTLTRLEYGEQGHTFFKDEPGVPPCVILNNIPKNWFKNGLATFKVAIALKRDSEHPSGYKTIRKPVKLSATVDRRFAKANISKLGEDFSKFAYVQRQYSESGVYRIPLCKGMDLSRRYQLGQEFLPDMYVVAISEHATGKYKAIHSKKFVVMSKRQPDVIEANRNPNASKKATRNGEKRMRRSEQIKALVSSNKQIVDQYKVQNAAIERLKRENGQMVQLLEQLNAMAKIGQATQSTDVLACFRICLGTTNNFNWMKRKAPEPTLHALGGSNQPAAKQQRQRI
jgi:hypothetical protein